MYYDEHNPPHFHAKYGEYEVAVEIKTGIVTGKFPRRALNAVIDWYVIHKEELMEDWELAQKDQKLNKIEPLE
ncbi:MAG: transcriptional regulator [Rickettsiales bacterium]|nr:MAG: transcriptional regulator [Rickettsiales bacterium]